MAANQAESYLDHPMFQQAQKSLQKGEWEAGLGQLDSLMQTYPLDHELRAYRQETALRARIDEEEKEDKADKRYRRFWNFSVRFAVVIGLLLLAFVVVRLYSNWFGEQIAMARQEVEYQVRGVELAVKFRDAQDYLQAGRTEDALKLIGEVAAAEPDYPGLADLKTNAEQKKDLEGRYNDAIGLYGRGDLAGALVVFEAIQDLNPNFRDSQLQVEKIKREILLGDTLKEADAAFAARQWETAAEKYDEIYIISPDYEIEYLEGRLYDSFINAAETRMAGAKQLEDLQTAEDYFRRALALRPQDPEVKAKQAEARKRVEDRLFLGYIDAAEALLAEGKNDLATYNQVKDYYRKAKALRPNDENIDLRLDLADKFVQAQDHYVQGLYAQVIDGLEYVYSQDKGYAKGTARQTLYEALVARGDSSAAVGDFNAALGDYQRGAVLAEEDPGSKLRLYEIQLKLADVMGVLGDYENAVLLYSSAVELAGLRERAQTYSDVMRNALKSAESFSSRKDFKNAWRSFRDAVQYGLETFEVVEHTVDSDDYVSSLAVEYGSTVSLIAAANNLENPNIIVPGQKLLIPILP